MKVPRHVIENRRNKLELLLATRRYLPLQEVCAQLKISEATARRDLIALQKTGRITRTHGGALSEFNDRFPSFTDRHRRGARSKLVIARAVSAVFREGGTYFLDSGTTLHFLAEALRESGRGGFRVLTGNLSAAAILSRMRDVEVYLTGGRMLPRQSVLLGEGAVRAIEGWKFDAAFLSAEGMNGEGLWNSLLPVIAHQHAVIRRSTKNYFLLDRAKLGRRAAHFLLSWPAVDTLVCDASKAAVRALCADIPHWHPDDPAPEVEIQPSASEGLPVHFL